MEIVYLAAGAALVALAYMVFLFAKVMKADEGDERIKELVSAIREGAQAFLSRQYKMVAIFLVVVAALLGFMSMGGLVHWLSPFAFLTAGIMSGLAGYLGMNIATASNGRTTHAARTGLNNALRVAFDGGSVMGMSVVGFGLLYICIWFVILQSMNFELRIIAEILVTSAMGASSVALFARVGGGIFTKAADVGADLAGKVEAGIPEDDPRNPAVIADNVGDNVGDVAGMGADLFESYVGSIVAAMALGISAFALAGLGEEWLLKGAVFPMLLAGVGIIASILGGFLIQAKEGATQEDLLGALRKGVFSSGILVAIFAFGLVSWIFGGEGSYWLIWVSMVVGLVSGIIIGVSSEYYTSAGYKPTKKVSETSQTGSATLIISGTALGMVSTAIPVLAVGLGIILSYLAGSSAAPNEASQVLFGLYGIGIAAVGMLSTLGVTLASDAYGPIADNAGGLAEMSGQDPKVRERTDALDSLGNTNAATGKGFAIGSAALTALALISNYNDKVGVLMAETGGFVTAKITGRIINTDFSLTDPFILVGMFIGGMLPFLFSALTMSSVGKAGGQIVDEVRRQFKEIPGLMEGKSKPDYTQCVDIATVTAHREMVIPAILAIVSPILVGLLFGVGALLGLLVGALVSGFLLAIFMANSGGSWDNAKKYIEEGQYGGKGSDAHKAAVVGDTVGDPFKDTSGPSINILVKLMSVVSLVFVALIVNFTLF